MAVWTPYVIREYAKNLEAVTARTADGRPLAIEKSRKNRWRIETGGADPVIVSYRVYCHVMGVQDNWVDDEFALLNGAPTFLTLGGRCRAPARRAHRPAARLEDHRHRDAARARRAAPLPRAGLRDAGRLAHRGRQSRHARIRRGGQAALPGGCRRGRRFRRRSRGRDLARIVREDARMWGGLPYDKYLFLNMLTGGGGGMEHSNSTALMSDRWNTRTHRQLSALAGSRQPRILPRLEREAAASRRVDARRV